MEKLAHLVLSIGIGAIIFVATMLIYGLGIAFGMCTWSTQLVTIVALNDLMVAAVLWMFWE